MTQPHFICEGIGTHWEFFLSSIPISNQEPGAWSMEHGAMELIKQFESDYSRFTKTSLVGKLNDERAIQTESEEFLSLLRFCDYLKMITDGYFDIMVGGTLEDLGYDSEYSFIEKEATSHKPQATDMSSETQAWSLDLKTQGKVKIIGNTVTLQGDGRIDLGGIGKGYLIRKIGQWLIQQGVESFCINAGGDIRSFGEEHSQTISIQDPRDANLTLGTLNTKQGCFAASGALYRSWGTNKHHLIDPHTHMPAITQVLAVHTHHPDDIVLADIASTTLFVCPSDRIPLYAERLGVEYMIIRDDMTTSCSEGYPKVQITGHTLEQYN